MLVLSRQAGQSIRIGTEVTVTVLNCRGNHIRIGISAPQDVPVHREEVFQRNQQPQGPSNCGIPTPPIEVAARPTTGSS